MAQATLQRQGVRLEAATIGWNAVEAVIGITAGLAASSVALIGFGLDSIVEVGAAVVVLWQFLGVAEERERVALRVIGASFFLLAAYVTVSSLSYLLTGAEPEASGVGIVLTAVSLVVMPGLAWAKRRTALAMNSRTLLADSKETAFCAWLSASTLAGLGLNAALGLWWADPAAALVIASFAVREGREAWTGDDCCDD